MRTAASTEVTRLLLAWREGDKLALEELLPLVYRELHAIARRDICKEVQGVIEGGQCPLRAPQLLNVSVDTVVRDWRLAKVWLHRELEKSGAA